MSGAFSIAELEGDPDSVVALPIPNDISPRERADPLNHLDAVVAEIHRRGRNVKTHIRRIPTGTVYAIDLVH